MENKVENLSKEKYPWLKITTTIKEYIDPEYYNKLLKDYIFNYKKDTQIFKDFLDSLYLGENIKALELGCGSGRTSEIFIDLLKTEDLKLELVDLSKRMLNFCQEKFKDQKNLKFIKSDSIKFLEDTSEVYEVIFSLWSFSHSVHQILIEKGLEKGKKYVQEVMRKMIKENMKKYSKFFLIHFDSLSDEQKILMRQWSKVFPIYNDLDIQSPSKLLINEVLFESQKKGIIELKLTHFEGEEIIYSSMDEALEIFLNFHMESYFNESPMLPHIIAELERYFMNFADDTGKIKIKPGCFIYEVEKK